MLLCISLKPFLPVIRAAFCFSGRAEAQTKGWGRGLEKEGRCVLCVGGRVVIKFGFSIMEMASFSRLDWDSFSQHSTRKCELCWALCNTWEISANKNSFSAT